MKTMFRIAFLLGVVCCSSAFAQGRWVKLAPFPEPAEELLGASANGKLYVFCGLAPGWKPIGMVYEYDPGADRWTKKSTMPLASHHVGFTEYRGKIYAFGGFVLPQSGPAVSPRWQTVPPPPPTGRGARWRWRRSTWFARRPRRKPAIFKRLCRHALPGGRPAAVAR